MSTNHLFFHFLVASAAASSVVGCGSDSSGDKDGSGGANNTGGTAMIDFGGSAGTTGTGTYDGGTVPLTDEEVTNILGAACTGWTGEGESLPAVLQLVVDVSGSMEDDAPGSNQSKWEVTRDALSQAIDTLPASVSAGVLYYPNQDTGGSASARDVDECVNVSEMVPIAMLGDPNSMHRDALQTSLDDANTGSLTPTHDAYRYALQNGLQPFQTQANKFMLLITDGAPTMSLGCIGNVGGGMMGGGGGNVTDAPTPPIVEEVTAAFATGIRTFLIGSPGSEESSQSDMDMRPWLSRAAQEGGTAAAGCQVDGPNFCHLDMTQEPDFAQALVAGLASVVGQIIDSCTFAVPSPPTGEVIDPALTTLIVQNSTGNTLVKRDNTGDCTEGWNFSTDGSQVELCGATCDRVKADASSRVQLMFGCAPDQVIPVR